MAVVGRATIIIEGDPSEFRKDAEAAGKQGGSALSRAFSSVTGTVRSISQKAAGAIGKAFKGGAIAAGATAVALIGTALTKGFSRLSSLENAQAKMRGLGYETGEVKKMMDAALASVDGTAFGLDEAANAAARMAAAGTPLDETEGVLTTIANSAAAAGTNMDDMAGIFAKAATSGKAGNDVLGQLADRGINIYGKLAEQLGITKEEVAALASEGKISFEQFEKAAADASGKVAEEMGKTVTGSIKNAWASLGRTGANLLSGVFDKIAPAVQNLTGWMKNNLEPAAKSAGEAIGKAMDWAAGVLGDTIGWIRDNAVPVIKDFIQGFKDGEGPGGKLREVLSGIGDVAKQVFNDLRDNLLPPIKEFIQQFRDGEGAGGAFRDILAAIGEKLKDAFGYLVDNAVPALESMYQWLKDNKDTLIVLGAAVVGYKVGVVAAEVATKAITAATKIWTVVTNAQAIAQRALNLVMKMNPIGLVVAAITALIAIVIIAYRENETFRKIVDTAWAGIKTAVSAVVDWFKNTAWPWMRDAFQWIGDKATWLWQNAIKPAWDKIKSGVSAVVTWVKDTAWPWMRDAFQNMADKAGDIKDKIVGAWDKMRSGISSGWDKIKGIFDKFKDGLQSLREKFSSVRDGIGRAWSALGGLIARPINAVIDTINGFLKKVSDKLNDIPGVNVGNWGGIPHVPVPSASSGGSGGGSTALAMAGGGEVPGWSPHPKADNIWARLTAGEFVLPVKATARIAQKIGRSGLEWLRRGMPGYANGGPVGGALEKGWDWVSGLWDKGADWVSDLFKRLMPDFGGSWPGIMAKGALSNLNWESIASALKDLALKALGGSGKDAKVVGGQHVNYGGMFGWAPSGIGVGAMVSMLKAIDPSARVTSGYRPGSITASGIPSLHSLGRAIDIVSSNMMDTFMKLRAAVGSTASQLYYTPAGGLQIGYRDSAVAAMHNDHIHWGYGDGGLVETLRKAVRNPFVADSGAVLGKGLNLLDNRTGAPEVLRPDNGGGSGPVDLSDASIEKLARAILRGSATMASQVVRESELAAWRGDR